MRELAEWLYTARPQQRQSEGCIKGTGGCWAMSCSKHEAKRGEYRAVLCTVRVLQVQYAVRRAGRTV